MPTRSSSDAVNLIETVIQSSEWHRSIPKPMLRPRHRLDSRVKVASRLSSTSSDKPRSSTAFIVDGRFFGGSLRDTLRRDSPPIAPNTDLETVSRTLSNLSDEFSLAFCQGHLRIRTFLGSSHHARPPLVLMYAYDGSMSRGSTVRPASVGSRPVLGTCRTIGRRACEVHGCARSFRVRAWVGISHPGKPLAR